MQTMDLIDLAHTETFRVSSLFAIKQPWREGQTFVMTAPRRQSAFLWFCGTEGEFTIKDQALLTVPRGGLVSIPQGKEYSVRFFNRTGTVSTVLIQFCLASNEDGTPFTITSKLELLEPHLEDKAIIDTLYKLTADYAMPSKPWLELTAGLYRLLHLLASREERRSLNRRGLQTIERGIRYLQFDEEQKLSIDEIAKMCFVTPAYFRRLFREYAGMTPGEYRTRRKIERACELLLHTDLSIAELSDLLGYEDPSYFCRVFKKQVGVPPSEYLKNPTEPYSSIEK